MNDFLQIKFLDNSLESYLYVIALILGALIIKRFISKRVASAFYKIVIQKFTSIPKNEFLNLVIVPLELFFVLVISFAAIEKLNFPSLLNFSIVKIGFSQILHSLAVAVLIFVLIWVMLRIVDFTAMVFHEKALKTEELSDDQLVAFFKDFFKVVLFIIGLLMVLKFSFNQNIGNLLTGLSIVGAAIALATRESLENLIASFIIFFDKPFTTGHLVKVEGQTGTVEKIGLRSTKVRTDTKTYITVPNKKMVDTIVDNLTLRTQRKVETRLEISLKTTSEQLKNLVPAIRELLNIDLIEDSNVYLSETGKEHHLILVEYFTSPAQPIKEFYSLREKFNLEFINALERLNIELAAKNADFILNRR